MKVRKTTLLILAIFFLGLLLRLAKLQENLLFSAEQAVEYLQIRDYLLEKRLPLLGPPSSHPWFVFGPIYYWLLMPVMLLFNFHPVGVAYLGALAGSLMILLNFWVMRKIFNEKVAFLSSLAVAVSPFLIEYSREGRFYFFVALPFYPFLWFLYRVWQGEGRFLFWVGLFFGLMLNFHLSPVGLIPVIFAILWLKRKDLARINLFRGFLGFLIPNLPFLIYDFSHGFLMTSKLLAWIPYRVASFFGFFPKNRLTPEVFRENLVAFYNFFSQSFVVGQKDLGILLTAVVIVFIALNFKKTLVTRKRGDFVWFFMLWSLLLVCLGLFLHGAPPKHYFIIIAPVLIVVFSLLVDKLWTTQLKGVLILVFFLLMFLSNLKFFFSSPNFYGLLEGNLLSFKFQEKIVKTITKDAKGEKFNLKRVGEFDYYVGEYAQNYRYTAWRLGNEPTEEKVSLRYTIYEETARIPDDIKEKGELFKVGKVLILKEIK